MRLARAIRIHSIIQLRLFAEQSGGKKVAYGVNSKREARAGCCYGLHAEMDAIRKLPPTYGSRIITLDLIIVRIGKTGVLKNSGPCFKCLEHLNRMKNKTNYRVKYIYYSDSSGNVKRVKFMDLLMSGDKHMSFRFRPKTK
jgi:hypothetical protein